MDVAIYDTTLRNGCRAYGCNLSVEDKLRVAARLDRLGFPYIEGGWPGSNPRDEQFFARARRQRWRQARLVAFGSTRRAGPTTEHDGNLQLLLLIRATDGHSNWNTVDTSPNIVSASTAALLDSLEYSLLVTETVENRERMTG